MLRIWNKPPYRPLGETLRSKDDADTGTGDKNNQDLTDRLEHCYIVPRLGVSDSITMPAAAFVFQGGTSQCNMVTGSDDYHYHARR